ncbi:hypothetical protein CCYA_CCYA04G1349 [Cyanidiococcus yangmingshanensis]|nr:hypothetical protein CCYA_CCYA04G1349 [Cyanidiococcus yangmingshanensis]
MVPTAFVTHVPLKVLRDRVSVARSSRCQRVATRDRLAVLADRSRLTAGIEAEEGSVSKSLASVVFKYFDRWNSRQIESILPIFAPQVHYEDALYPRPLQNREALYQHLTKAARVLPQYLIFVIDDVCEDPERGRCAVRFHLEDKRSGKRVPFSRGTSFFTAMRAPETPDGWLITSGWDVPEPFLKAGNILLGIAGFAAVISGLARGTRSRS